MEDGNQRDRRVTYDEANDMDTSKAFAFHMEVQCGDAITRPEAEWLAAFARAHGITRIAIRGFELEWGHGHPSNGGPADDPAAPTDPDDLGLGGQATRDPRDPVIKRPDGQPARDEFEATLNDPNDPVFDSAQ